MSVEQIRVRIMSEAYDLADRGDTEGYNAVKVMCSDVLALIKELLADARTTEREACADIADQHASCEGIAQRIAAEIRRRK